MISPTLRPVIASLIVLASAATVHAQAAAQQSTAEQLKSWIALRQPRVDLLRDEVKQIDARIEARLDTIIGTLKSIADTKDSGTKVARMKEDTGKRLMKTIAYYDNKRAAMKEELRSPRLRLTEEEKKRVIAVLDAKIQKRTQQILELHKSMPTHKDYERYTATGGGWQGTEYRRNLDYEQNERMTTKSNTQRDAVIKELESSIARLDRQARNIKTQIPATNDPLQRKTLNEELAKTEALMDERRRQRLEALKPSGTPATGVGLKQAMDMDKALQTAINDLRSEFNTLFARYNSLLAETSTLHLTEDALAAKTKR
jgi:hypothetical protein